MRINFDLVFYQDLYKKIIMKTYILLFILLFSQVMSNAQTLVSQFDFLVADLKVAAIGNDGLSYNTSDARLASGGGVYFIHSGGSTGLDLEIPRADFENLESVTFSFDYMRLESFATFFEMDDFKFHMDGGEVKIEYKVTNNASTIIFNTGFNLTSNVRVLVKVSYDKATGVLKVFENNNLKASNTTTAGESLDWSAASGNAFVGVEMDGSGSSTASLYQFQIYDESSDGTLPIELISFSAEKLSTMNVLNWTTASEINNSYFEIQRSTDNKNFKTIDTKTGAGNSNKTINYTYYDYNTINSTVYYRLMQVDFDGKFEYSNSVVVNQNTTDNSIIYPNPVGKNEVFNIIAEQGSLVSIFNSSGQKISEYRVSSKIQSPEVIKNAGIYFITIYDEMGNTISSKSLIVK